MNAMESAAIGKPVSMYPVLPRSLNFLPMLALHTHDINLQLCHLPQPSQTSCSDISFREMSLESENRQRIETPASSVELEMGDIDPCLLKALPVLITRSLPCHSDTEVLTRSGGSVVEILTKAQPKFQLGDRREVLEGHRRRTHSRVEV